MNEELRGAKLLSNGPETVDEQFNRTYAGFLGKVEASGVDAPDDLVKITFGIHTEVPVISTRRSYLQARFLAENRPD